jgi:hypothetical protein
MMVKVHGEQRIFQTVIILLAKGGIHMRYFDISSSGRDLNKVSFQALTFSPSYPPLPFTTLLTS